MNNTLLFDFTVDKEAKTVYITKEFDAGIDLVWDAFTKVELLDQWWAPKPFTSRSKRLDFEVGGSRFYAMVGPDGSERWAVQQYKSITPKTNFKLFNAFSDAEENLQLPGSDWDLNFSEENGVTTVRVSVYNESLARMEGLLEGFRLGFMATMKNLEELLQETKEGLPK